MTSVNIEIKKIKIPGFIEKLPDNIVDQLVGMKGGYRLQRSIGEHLRHAWKIKTPLYFHRRSDLKLPVSHQFENALTYKITSRDITLLIKPCHGTDGFNYVHSLMKGRQGIDGKHFCVDIDKLVPKGNVRATTSGTFERLFESIKTHFTTNIGSWSKTLLVRAIHAAGGSK